MRGFFWGGWALIGTGGPVLASVSHLDLEETFSHLL